MSNKEAFMCCVSFGCGLLVGAIILFLLNHYYSGCFLISVCGIFFAYALGREIGGDKAYED